MLYELEGSRVTDYQERLGQRLRAIRTQQGLTLQEVEEKSGGEWKAVVVGSYERGDRAVSVPKLARLAEFYGVPISELLPEERTDAEAIDLRDRPKVILDLAALEGSELDPMLKPLSRFAHTIQLQRGDYNGRILTVRHDDLLALSVVYGMSPEDFVERLEDDGLLADIQR